VEAVGGPGEEGVVTATAAAGVGLADGGGRVKV